MSLPKLDANGKGTQQACEDLNVQQYSSYKPIQQCQLAFESTSTKQTSPDISNTGISSPHQVKVGYKKPQKGKERSRVEIKKRGERRMIKLKTSQGNEN